jgi:hypothetical protein
VEKNYSWLNPTACTHFCAVSAYFRILVYFVGRQTQFKAQQERGRAFIFNPILTSHILMSFHDCCEPFSSLEILGDGGERNVLGVTWKWLKGSSTWT